MHLLLEADGLMEARALRAAAGLDLGSQARVSGQILKALLLNLPAEAMLTIASGKRLVFDALEQTCVDRLKVKRAWLPRPALLPFGNKFSVLPVRHALERYYYPYALRSPKADVIHYTQRFPLGDAPLAPREIWTALDIFPMYSPDSKGLERIRKLRRRLQGVEVMAISQTTADDVRRILHVPESRISVNYLGADRNSYKPGPVEDEAAQRKAMHLPPQFFFYSGALYGRKNVITLLKALERFNEDRKEPPIPLIAAGGKGWPGISEAAEFAKVAKRMEGKGLYRHLGWRTDAEMAVAHRACLAYVHPATFEGFGMTILEAMSCGAPIICGRNSAVSEVAGSAAEYVDDLLSVEAMAAALRKIASTPDSTRAGMRALSLAQAGKFSWEQFREQVVQLTWPALSSIEPSPV